MLGVVSYFEGAYDEALLRLRESLRLDAVRGSEGIATVDTLSSVAAALAAKGIIRQSAMLLDACDHFAKESGAWREPFVEDIRRETVERLEARDPGALAAAQVAGRALTFDEALALALHSWTDRGVVPPHISFAPVSP